MYQHCGIESKRGKNKRLLVKNRYSNTVRLNVHMFKIFNTPQYHSFPIEEDMRTLYGYHLLAMFIYIQEYRPDGKLSNIIEQ
jgi:hypothetical protein